MDAQPSVGLALWERALLDVLLPSGEPPGQPALLACDDDALRAAARRLDLPEADGASAFAGALVAEHAVSAARGLHDTVSHIRAFERGARPRGGPPPFLGALCATVLAASRMDRDEQHATSAYYARLSALLGIEPLTEWPAVAGFKEVVQDGFSALAGWLADDMGGKRGLLIVPARPQPSLVGIPISQTLLRGRDRALLSVFFHAHERQLHSGFDPVVLLRRWGGRERLTQPAQQVLGDPGLVEPLAAALHAALAAWDGAVHDEHGKRSWPALLRLAVRPGRAVLRLAVPALTASVEAQGPHGQLIALRAHPLDSALPVELLADAGAGPVRLTLDGGDTVRAISGPTVLFEIAGGGLQQVPAAAEQLVWVLSCESEVLAVADEGDRFAAPLPAGWELLADIEPRRLPERLRFAAGDEGPLRGAQLAGGLPLGHGAWLVDHPPHVVCDVPEPAAVELDGADYGYLEPGQPLQLDELAGRAGTHHLSIGDLYELSFELRETGLRESIGSLRHHPRDPTLARAGAVEAVSDGPQVTGAVIEGDGPVSWRPPMLLRVDATVHVIYSDGSVRPCAPPQPPAWLRQVGLGHAVDRWEIPDAERAVWLCVDSDPHPRILAVADGDVAVTDEVLALVDWFAEEPVIDRADGDAERRWRALVKLAHSEEAGVAD